MQHLWEHIPFLFRNQILANQHYNPLCCAANKEQAQPSLILVSSRNHPNETEVVDIGKCDYAAILERRIGEKYVLLHFLIKSLMTISLIWAWSYQKRKKINSELVSSSSWLCPGFFQPVTQPDLSAMEKCLEGKWNHSCFRGTAPQLIFTHKHILNYKHTNLSNS